MTPEFFAKQSGLRKWFEKNHKKETELIVGFYKVNSGKPSITWSQSVDQALCFGWIDGVRKSIDKDSYQIRFTPRKPTSTWSIINIQKIKELTKQGLMKPAGIASFKSRKENKSKLYAHENEEIEFSPHVKKHFKANRIAWNYFQSLAPTYRKSSKNWVMSAKQETTREKRLRKLIEDSEASVNMWKDSKYQRSAI